MKTKLRPMDTPPDKKRSLPPLSLNETDLPPSKRICLVQPYKRVCFEQPH